MGRFLHLRFAKSLRKYAAFALACSWILGLLLGTLTARSIPAELSPLVGSFQNQSPISLVTVMLFPVLVSFLVVYMGHSWLLPLIAFLKSFSFAYVSWVLTKDFRLASWLIHLLTMFSDCLSLPLLWWFWCRLLKSDKPSLFAMSLLMTFAIVTISILDHRFIAPILSSLQIS